MHARYMDPLKRRTTSRMEQHLRRMRRKARERMRNGFRRRESEGRKAVEQKGGVSERGRSHHKTWIARRQTREAGGERERERDRRVGWVGGREKSECMISLLEKYHTQATRLPMMDKSSLPPSAKRLTTRLGISRRDAQRRREARTLLEANMPKRPPRLRKREMDRVPRKVSDLME